MHKLLRWLLKDLDIYVLRTDDSLCMGVWVVKLSAFGRRYRLERQFDVDSAYTSFVFKWRPAGISRYPYIRVVRRYPGYKPPRDGFKTIRISSRKKRINSMPPPAIMFT